MPQRVCVIGGGASGLIAIHHIAKDPTAFEGVVFEQTDSLGGIWNYTDSVGLNEYGLPIHSTAYKGLRTNLPKEIMGYLEYPFQHESNVPSYIGHGDVLRYLREFAHTHRLRQHIKFLTRVIAVRREQDKWNVTTEHMRTKHQETQEFDKVLVCNGHYTRPNIPPEKEISNISRFPHPVIHSRDYRLPHDFKNKRVVVLGAGPSAIDISIEIADHASQVMLSCKSCPYKMPSHVSVHSKIVAVDQHGQLVTEDGDTLDCDVLFLCSGYLYDFPFLDHHSCGVEVVGGKYVRPLYRHLINANHPSMAFIGIPFSVCPFPLFDCQIRYTLSVWKGTTHLPQKQEMLEEIEQEESSRELRNIPLHHSHKFGDIQWEYNKMLAEESGVQSLIRPVVEQVYQRAGQRRIDDPANYKHDRVTINNDHEFQYDCFSNCKRD